MFHAVGNHILVTSVVYVQLAALHACCVPETSLMMRCRRHEVTKSVFITNFILFSADDANVLAMSGTVEHAVCFISKVAY
jgi:hypothetical protein